MSAHPEGHVAAEARQTARHMFEDVAAHKPNGLERAIDEIDAERRTHSAADFRQYMVELNKAIQDKLPGLTIVDAGIVNNQKSMLIDQRSGPRRLHKDDGEDMATEIRYQAMLAESRRGVPQGRMAAERKQH